MKRLLILLLSFFFTISFSFPASYIAGGIQDGSTADFDISIDLGSLSGSLIAGVMEEGDVPGSLTEAVLVSAGSMLDQKKPLEAAGQGYAAIDGLYFFYYVCSPDDVTISLYADEKMEADLKKGNTVGWSVSLGDKKNSDCNSYDGTSGITGEAEAVRFSHVSDTSISSYAVYPLKIETTESYLTKPVDTYTGSLHIKITAEGN